MNHPFNAGSAGIFDAGISLHQLVNRIICNSQPIAIRNKITIANAVPPDFRIFTDEDKVSPVINELLTTVVSNGCNSRIYVSAERFRDIIILQIQDSNNNNGYALTFSIMSIESQAAEVGGSISIDGKQKKITTISFSFPNYAQIA